MVADLRTTFISLVGILEYADMSGRAQNVGVDIVTLEKIT